MSEAFVDILAVGGKSNSLGRVNEVIGSVLADSGRIEELFDCLSNDDTWLRMRAADALEKVCRTHPEWIAPYIDRLSRDMAESGQASLLWHLAQIYAQVDLTPGQKQRAIEWLEEILSTSDVDWIVAANAMDTLARFVRDGSVPVAEARPFLEAQRGHRSKAVMRRATKLLDGL